MPRLFIMNFDFVTFGGKRVKRTLDVMSIPGEDVFVTGRRMLDAGLAKARKGRNCQPARFLRQSMVAA